MGVAVTKDFLRRIFVLNKKLQNDFTIAFGIMVLFAANNTLIHIQKLITASIKEDNANYLVDGYVIYGIMFSVLAITVWFSPAIVQFCGLKRSLILGALGSIPMATFFYFENTYLTYTSAAISGSTTGILWTAQAVYLTLNSEIGNVYTSISIFAMVFQLSEVLGNGAISLQFAGEDKLLNHRTRRNIALTLLAFVLTSVFILSFLRPAIREIDDTDVTKKPSLTFCEQTRTAFAIVTTKNMMLACIYFSFIGVSVTFMNVMCTTIGFSNFLSSNAKKYIAYVGLMQGVGEMIGGISSFYLKKKVLLSRPLFVPLGCIANAIAHSITALGLPDSAVQDYTNDLPIVHLPFALLLLSNLLVGLSDAYLHIEAYNYIASSYSSNSAPAFAVLKVTRYSGTAISFYFSSSFGLHVQAAIALGLNLLSALSYFYLTSKSLKEKKDQESIDATLMAFTQQAYESSKS